MTVSLGYVDLIVLILSVSAAIVLGLRLGGKNDSVEAFLVGNRNLPWWAILGSIVATETSTATVLSVPGIGYGPVGMRFLQIALGYILGRLIVVQLLLPLFFQGKLFSAYEVLNNRFGGQVKSASSLLFLVARNLGDGLRLFLAAVVLQQLVGWNFAASAAAIGLITIVYTFLGGMRSVVWNDCIQFVVYMLGGVASIFVIVSQIPGGWGEFWEFAEAGNKLQLLQFTPDEADERSLAFWLLTEPFSFWAGLIGGAILTLGTHGTDQMMVQRYLSARSQRDASRAIVLSALVVMGQFALFLFIGTQLACFYHHFPTDETSLADGVYAHFIINHFPKDTGLIGLMLAAILAAAMSTLSSSLNASASAVLNDFLLPWSDRRGRPISASGQLQITRFLAVAFGVLQVGIGIVAITFDQSVVSNALTIAGYSAGLLLGLFLLGVLTKHVSAAAALTGALAGLVSLLSIQFLLPVYEIKIAWPWFAAIGSSVTFAVGIAAATILPSHNQTTSEPSAHTN
ncbi:MAG: sodium:solute symporter [Aureliella sp.]